MTSSDPTPSHPRSPIVAALLSLLLPGLGQLYGGNLIRALAFACASVFAGLGLGWMFLQSQSIAPAVIATLLIGLAVSIAAAVDAFRLARPSRSHYRLNSVNQPAIYALFIILGMGANLGASIGFSSIIRDRFVEAFVIPTEAMAPTIEPGDRVLAFKGVYVKEDPKRGDLVIFKAPEKRWQNWIKRVVALPGETVAIKDGTLLINGRAFEPDGYEVSGMDTVEDFPEITVPDHHCFVLGDNRAIAKDSRSFGPLGFGSITARVESCFWPPERAGKFQVAE